MSASRRLQGAAAGAREAREMDMADPAEPQRPQTDKQALGDCAWCGAPAVTMLFTEGSKKAKSRKKAPVCAEHETHFLAQGATSQRSEADDSGPKNARRYVIR